MSAGDAGPAQGQQAQGQGEGGGEAQQGAPDFSALQSTLEQQGQSLEQLREYLQSNPWQSQEQPEQAEPEQENLDLGFLESGDPEFDQQLAQNLQGLIQSEAQKVAQQQYGPLQEQIQTMQRERAAQDLVGEFPELNEPEHAQRIIAMSREYAEMMNRPDLADEPQMWRLMHLANAAMVARQEEQQHPAAHLEGGGGAGASQQPQQVNPIDLIMNRGDGEGLGGRVLDFGR